MNLMSIHAEMVRYRHDGHTDGFSALYSRLAKVPALSCRMGRVPYDRAFSALTGGCAPYDRAFGALIVHSLSITKSLTKEKSAKLQDSNLTKKFD